MKGNKMLSGIVGLIFIVFAIILIIQLILKLTGHSPTDIQILYVTIGVIISYLLIAGYKIGIFVGEAKEFMKVTKNSFSRISEDMKKLKK